MPIVINKRDQGSKKREEKKARGRIQSVTSGGVLSDVRTVIAIVGGVVLLLVGLLGWSQGWFGGAAPVPAHVSSQSAANASSQPGADAGSPMEIGPESNPMGNKRNKDLGQ
ncbi:MAG: hypothetical protein JWL77_6084 [Chthonomonadaceae bacterium]|nr:hypothetical protein [Chthonomonadaceae bacterium]